MNDRLTDLAARTLVERLATSDPTPGGGSAAALTGAMGAALVQMVVSLTSGRPAAEDHQDALLEIGNAAATAQSDLLRLTELDAAAYASVVNARRLPRETELERQSRDVQVATAIREATMAPLETARRAADVLTLAERLAPIGNRNAISDVGVGATLAVAAMRGAALNVRINLPSLAPDDPLRAEAAGGLRTILANLDERERSIRQAVEERLG